MKTTYDVIVVGGGHAGCEAANAAARLGADTVLITSVLARVAQMSCNPAIGGIAKGTVAREVDALGGLMGRATDRSTLHVRMLNRSKGPAVWAPRAQCDRGLYPRQIRTLLEENERLDLYQGMVGALLLRGDRVSGVSCADGSEFRAERVVLTAGTFLRGSIKMGATRSIAAGRAGDPPSVELAEQLLDLGLAAERFKTGTPPRVDGRSVDFTKLRRQESEQEPLRFSHWERTGGLARMPCWIGSAGSGVREVVEDNLSESAMYGGADRLARPALLSLDRGQGQEVPRGAEPPGLPRARRAGDDRALRERTLHIAATRRAARVPGAASRASRNARMTQPGYAIEYDYFPPQQLRPTLELQALPGSTSRARSTERRVTRRRPGRGSSPASTPGWPRSSAKLGYQVEMRHTSGFWSMIS